MFSQIESTLDRSRGGLGIGLSLTQRLVELHGGRVTASSAGLGLGSEFEVHLPLANQDNATNPEVDEQDKGTALENPGRQLRILVADDNEDSASTLAFLFEAMGHAVAQANDGEAAVHQTTQFDPDLILLDIGMPKLNGYEVCRQIRTVDKGRERTIVAVTGWGQPNDRRLSQEAGFDKHLVKPLGQAELDEVIAAMNGITKLQG